MVTIGKVTLPVIYVLVVAPLSRVMRVQFPLQVVNIVHLGLIAQLAEQRFEDPRVSGSIPFQTIYTDMVERHTHWT